MGAGSARSWAANRRAAAPRYWQPRRASYRVTMKRVPACRAWPTRSKPSARRIPRRPRARERAWALLMSAASSTEATSARGPTTRSPDALFKPSSAPVLEPSRAFQRDRAGRRWPSTAWTRHPAGFVGSGPAALGTAAWRDERRPKGAGVAAASVLMGLKGSDERTPWRWRTRGKRCAGSWQRLGRARWSSTHSTSPSRGHPTRKAAPWGVRNTRTARGSTVHGDQASLAFAPCSRLLAGRQLERCRAGMPRSSAERRRAEHGTTADRASTAERDVLPRARARQSECQTSGDAGGPGYATPYPGPVRLRDDGPRAQAGERRDRPEREGIPALRGEGRSIRIAMTRWKSYWF